MNMAWMQRSIHRGKGAIPVSTQSLFSTSFSGFFSKSTTPYIAKVGIPEFLNGIGKGVESHVAKLPSSSRSLRKLILKHTHKYRLGLWRPRTVLVTS